MALAKEGSNAPTAWLPNGRVGIGSLPEKYFQAVVTKWLEEKAKEVLVNETSPLATIHHSRGRTWIPCEGIWWPNLCEWAHVLSIELGVARPQIATGVSAVQRKKSKAPAFKSQTENTTSGIVKFPWEATFDVTSIRSQPDVGSARQKHIFKT